MIKALRITDQNIVEYSTCKINMGHFYYVPIETIEKRELSTEKMEQLRDKIAAVRWARCDIGDKNDICTIHKRWTPNEYYLKESLGSMVTHTTGPSGYGSNYNSLWQEISDLVLN